MPQTVVDCKGMACPKPVLECRSIVESLRPESLEVLVDNPAARENVSRYLAVQGYTVTSGSNADGVIRLMAEKVTSDERPQGDNTPAEECQVLSPDELSRLSGKQRVAVFISSSGIGTGDELLGAKLMKNFLLTLPELGGELWRVILVNGAVRLAAEDSPVLADLQKIEQSGTTILVCGTCLEFFGLLEKRAVGQTTNMLDVVTSLQLASKVITL